MTNIATFNAESLIDVILEARKHNCHLLLVKDHGIYMMSKKGKKNSKGIRTLSYAVGCNPNTDDDYYLNAKEIMGGDDSCDVIPNTDKVLDLVVTENKDLKIEFTATKFRCYVV